MQASKKEANSIQRVNRLFIDLTFHFDDCPTMKSLHMRSKMSQSVDKSKNLFIGSCHLNQSIAMH